MDLLGPSCALASSITWAFASGEYARASAHLGAARVNFARALFACAGWGLWIVLSGELTQLARLEPDRVLWLALSIVCSYVLGDAVFYAAAQRAGVATALAVATVYPLWAALYGVLVRGELLGPLRLAGLAGAVLGVVLLLRLSHAACAAARPAETSAVSGILLALLASLFWAGNAICLKQGAEGVATSVANVVRFGLGAGLLLPRVLFAAPPARPADAPSPLRALLVPLVLDTWLGSAAYVYGLAHSELALGATLSSLSPVAALPMGVLSGAERVTPARAGCVVLIVLAVSALVLG